MSFRHEYSGTPPNTPLSKGIVVYWVDLPELEPLSMLYPTLREAEEDPDNKVRQWTIPIQGGRREITAHAVFLLKPAGLAQEGIKKG